MTVQTYARGVLLWIDDRFEDQDAETVPEYMWREVFGKFSDRVYRLMDLSLEFVCSCDEAEHAIQNAVGTLSAGTYVFCVLDLSLPPAKGHRAALKYGIQLARRLREHSIHFVFLSANSHATAELNRADLGTVDYHRKSPGDSDFQLPETLGRSVLSEFRRNISWVTLKDVFSRLTADSTIMRDYRQSEDIFNYFPFFGPFRDFVERWEHRDGSDLPGTFVVRASREHSDEFVQQCILVILFDVILGRDRETELRFISSDEIDLLDQQSVSSHEREDRILIVRINPEHTSLGVLRSSLQRATRCASTVVFLLPNDETVDQFAEVLQREHVPTIEDLPQCQWGDSFGRSELVKQTCALMFQRWSLRAEAREETPLPRGYLEYPQLLINPISWVVLHEARSVATELSDPYELLKELDLALSRIGDDRCVIQDALLENRPVPYRHLLWIGRDTLHRSQVVVEIPRWLEHAIDMWLNTSWHFPYGLANEFARLQHADNAREAWRPHCWKEWEDHCFEVLTGILLQYQQYGVTPESSRQRDLTRVQRFVDCLDGPDFLDEAGVKRVNWNALESLRWPHHRYPLPAAINRRLKSAGRYLWIQPEGLDIAPSLPTGRQRYGFLADVIQRYTSVLDWAESIAEYLPRGWSESVAFLTRTIRNNAILDTWKSRREDVWNALQVMMRNGVVVHYLSGAVLGGQRLAAGKDSPRSVLAKAGGAGIILYYARKAWDGTAAPCLVSLRDSQSVRGYNADLTLTRQLIRALAEGNGADDSALSMLGRSLISLLESFSEPIDSGDVSLHEMCQVWNADEDAGPREKKGWSIESEPLKSQSELLDRVRQDHRLQAPAHFRSQADWVNHLLDTAAILNQAVTCSSAFDGYSFLSMMNDIRVDLAKTGVPDLTAPQLESLFDLFLLGLEGMVAQLAVLLDLSDASARAERLNPPSVRLNYPSGFEPPTAEDLASVLQIHDENGQFAVGTLGLPGQAYCANLCFQDSDGSIVTLDALRQPPPAPASV